MTDVYVKKPYLKNNNSADTSNKITPRTTFNGYYKMNEIASIYNFPKPTSANYVAAVVSFGGGIYGKIDSNGVLTNSDCQAYWSYIGINVADHPKVIVKTILGAKNVPSDKDDGMTIENILDVETIGGACPTSNLTIILYIAPNSSTFDSVFSYIYNSSYRPNIISCSWGMSEIYVDTTELNMTNTLFKQITDSGINICVATGDYGSNNGVPRRGNYVDFPASSPYVTALGGTTLTCPNYIYDSNTKEIGWTRGGGGISVKFSKPTYQKSLTCNGRSIPDISSCSDPKTGVIYIINGKKHIIGGTSVAAPTFAGYLAAINYKSFINPFLYSSTYNCYNDVLTGSNGGYKASLGYDQCTGLGSINGKILQQELTNTGVICKGLKVTPNTVNISVGNVLQLTISIVPDNAINKTVTYDLATNKNCSISKNGIITGLSGGRNSLTVKTTDGSSLSFVVPIKVSMPFVPCQTLTVIPNKTTIKTGTTIRLSPIITPANSTNKIVTYTSSKPTFISVTSTGVVLGIKQGTVNIIVKTTDSSNLSYTVPITVVNNIVNVQKITVSPNNYNMMKGTKIQLTAYVSPYNVTFPEIVWTCSNKNISVDQTGLVTALTTGIAVIYATSLSNNKYLGTCTLRIL